MDRLDATQLARIYGEMRGQQGQNRVVAAYLRTIANGIERGDFVTDENEANVTAQMSAGTPRGAEDQQITAIRARHAAAPKQWRYELNDPLYGYCTIQTSEGRVAEVWGDESRTNFIVNAHADIEALLAALARLTAENEALREATTSEEMKASYADAIRQWRDVEAAHAALLRDIRKIAWDMRHSLRRGPTYWAGQLMERLAREPRQEETP